ncbi:MAG: hypothetical protein GEV08_23300 [Acidimicrobiia bacterium]|nr:hypothetical protein [Acidimicrobiia bacterium]
MHAPVALQRVLAAGVTYAAIRRLSRRQAPLPERGPKAAAHLTAVLRFPLDVASALDLGALPASRSHYRYPLSTLHVTVANLDQACVPAPVGVEALRALTFEPVTLRLDGFGCSRDTLFIRCSYGEELAVLRRAVRRAFALPRPFNPVKAAFGQLAFANVLRFDGPGVAPARGQGPEGLVVLDNLDVVRTDRYLSDEATTVLARVPLDRCSAG